MSLKTAAKETSVSRKYGIKKMKINILSSGLSKGLLHYYFLIMANKMKMLTFRFKQAIRGQSLANLHFS